MKKTIKIYVEKLYPGVIYYDSHEYEVEERNPEKIKNNGNVQGFRFFDVEYVIDSNKKYKGEKANYSNWYFYGSRLNINDLEFIFGDNTQVKKLIKFMKNNGYEYACYTQTGNFIPMETEDMTYEEYILGKKKVLRKD